VQLPNVAAVPEYLVANVKNPISATQTEKFTEGLTGETPGEEI
jgi:hypothetical protein